MITRLYVGSCTKPHMLKVAVVGVVVCQASHVLGVA